MCVLTTLKILENNGTEEIGLVTPTPGGLLHYSKSVLNTNLEKSHRATANFHSCWMYVTIMADSLAVYQNLKELFLEGDFSKED